MTDKVMDLGNAIADASFHLLETARNLDNLLEKLDADNVEETADDALSALEIFKALKIDTIKRYASK